MGGGGGGLFENIPKNIGTPQNGPQKISHPTKLRKCFMPPPPPPQKKNTKEKIYILLWIMAASNNLSTFVLTFGQNWLIQKCNYSKRCRFC